MAWWLNRGGRPEGPYQDGQIYQLIQSGQLRGAHICEDGAQGWTPIEQHPVFGPAMQGGAGPMPAQPALAHSAPARKKSRSRVAIIVSAVIGTALLVTAGLFFLLRDSASEDDGKGLDPKEATRRAAACKKSLAAIEKIDAAAVPPVETDGYLDKSVYVSFTFEQTYADDNRSVILIHAEDLKEPGLYRDDLKPRVPGSSAVTGCALALKAYEESKKESKKKRQDEAFMKGCTKLKYLAVVRVREHVAPEVTSTTENETANTRTHIFEPGKITGDVVMFSLESGKPMGGFSFAAESSEKPDRTFDGKDLETDLMKQLVKALNEGDDRARKGARGGS
jgi:hypothetical protein